MQKKKNAIFAQNIFDGKIITWDDFSIVNRYRGVCKKWLTS